MADKIVNYVTIALLGIDGLIVLWFFFLVYLFFMDPYGGTDGQILRELRKQNDPEFKKKELEAHQAVSRALLQTLGYGGLFIMASFGIIFLMLYLTGRW